MADEFDNMSRDELLLRYNQMLAKQGKQIVPTEAPTSETDLTGLVGANAQDIGRGLYHGGVAGISNLAGAPADLAEMGMRGYNAAQMALDPKGLTPVRPPQEPAIGSSAMQSAVDRYVTAMLGGPIGKPQSGIGKLTERAAEYAPALAFGKERYALRPLTRLLGPMVGESTAGAMTDDNPYARLGGAMVGGPIAGRAITPFRAKDPIRAGQVARLQDEGINAMSAKERTGSRALAMLDNPSWASPEEMNRQMTANALRKAGTKGDNFLGEELNKTVLPEHKRELGKEFDKYEKTGPDDSGYKKIAQIYDPSFGRGEVPKELRAKYRIASDLERASKGTSPELSSGRFTPKDLIRASKEHSDKDFHGLASAAQAVKAPVEPYNYSFPAALSAGLAGALLGHKYGGNLYGLGGGLGAAYGGHYLPRIAAHGLSPLLTNKTIDAYLGNQAIPLPMHKIGAPKSLGLAVYSGPGRNPKEKDKDED